MAPALPIYSRDEVEKMYPGSKKFSEIPSNCEMYKLTQNECTYDGNRVLCLPFKRMFMRCHEYKSSEYSGYKLQSKNRNSSGDGSVNGETEKEMVYRNVEITKREDNKIDLRNEDVCEFLEADVVLKRNMREYYKREKGIQ